MRRKKQKTTRRTVAFYKVNYGLHEPFKVLLDGNFIHATLLTGLGDLDKHLQDLLGGRVQTFVTPCVMHELRNLGADFKGTVKAAQKIKLHYCGHGKHGKAPPQHKPGGKKRRTPLEGEELEGPGAGAGEADGGAEQGDAGEGEAAGQQQGEESPVAASECLAQQIRDNNPSHWWVATQDKLLREKLASVPGMPLLFATANGIHLETPSEMTKTAVKQVEEASMALPAHERRSKALEDLEAIRPKMRTNVKFRRNKAKGPNPLAVKKKSTKQQQQQQQQGQQPKKAAEGEDAKRKRKRRPRPAEGAGGQEGA